MYLFGTILILAGATLALLSSISYALTIAGKRGALIYGRVGVYGSLFVVSGAWLMLVGLFLGRRFDFDYVFHYSDSSLNVFYTIAATWGGQPGSFAIWAFFNAIVAALLVGRTRHFEPYVLAVYMLIQAFLIALMTISNPFLPLINEQTGLLAAMPEEGSGLNPLLHNFWMILHPPVLFVGYALVLVPFAFAIGGVLRHDYDGWVTRALPWTLAAWGVLGLALLLGAYWAYETLGWGGYWGWDPVENSSLVPWILITALFHSMLVQRSHGALRRTNIVLTIVTFLSVIYSTFLTRSGVLSNFSVHSFVAEGLSEAMIGLLALIMVGGAVVVVMRWRDVPSRPLESQFFSRESFSVLAVVVLVVIAVVISIGTSMPVISAIPGVGHSLQDALGSVFELDDGTALGGQPLEDGRFSLMPSFYERVVPPLALIMMIMLIFSPLMDWRDTNWQRFIKGMRVPLGAAFVAAVVAILIGVRHPMSLAYITIGTMAAGTNIVLLIRTIRAGWYRVGGYLSHLGLCILVVGIVGSDVYASPDERVILASGETASIYGFDFTFNEWLPAHDGKGIMDITVGHGNETFNARPQFYFDQGTNSTMMNPAIRTYPLYDLYIAPVEYKPEENPNQPMVVEGQLHEVGPYKLMFNGFQVDEQAFEETGVAEIGANMSVTYEGETSTVTPKINLTPSQGEAETNVDPTSGYEEIPAALPGNGTLYMKMFDPTRRMVLLEVEGLNLPVQPAQAVITVSTKPLVLLVWIGVLVSILGGFIALYRRYRECEAQTLPHSRSHGAGVTEGATL